MNTYQILTIILPFLILLGSLINMFYNLSRRITILETEFKAYINKESDRNKELVREEIRKETHLLLTEKQHREDYDKLDKKLDDLKDLVIKIIEK